MHTCSYPYVLRGYRCGGTYARCAAALFEWHTETLNAWTMIWASCLSIFLLTRALSTLKAAGSSTTTSGSYWPGLPDQTAFWLLTTATVLHAPFSVCFHLFRGIRTDVYNLWRRLDQVFIFQVGRGRASRVSAVSCAACAVNALHSLHPNIKVAFVVGRRTCTILFSPKAASQLTHPNQLPTSPSNYYPKPPPRAPQVSQLLALGIAWFVYESYWGIALNTLAAFVVAQLGTRDIWAVCPDYQRNRTHMVAFVGCIVLCYWWPMGVQATRDCLAWLRPVLLGGGATAAAAAAPSWAAVGFSLGTFISLATGGAVFASGWPERALPGVFDIIGFSHQLMHVAAMAAHAFEFAFMLEMWARRRQETGV